MASQTTAGQTPNDESLRVLSFWWMVEMFSPQKIPPLTKQATRPTDRQVIEWGPGDQLPWDMLRPPPPLGDTRRVWRHTVYLGVYNLKDTYETLHQVFQEDPDAYDERPNQESACSGIVIGHDGRLIADSVVLSSALWATGRARDPGPTDPQWIEGFNEAQAELIKNIDELEGRRRDIIDDDQPPPIDDEALAEVLNMAHAAATVSGVDGLATNRIVIDSFAVSARRAEEVDSDFLNSFFLDDLTAVRGHVANGNVGPALAAYLTADTALRTDDRVDVVDNTAAVDAGASIHRLPKGRWPAKPQHSLALSQQFAVNQALNELAPTAGLLGVNGPPGTGKTTMLREILAGNVVERARRLAALKNAKDAFIGDPHRWTVDGGRRERTVPQLRPELTGFEMVLASANNAAVENVTNEIPALKAIDATWWGKADYFADIATEVLKAAADAECGPSKLEAWGLVAARLGKKSNRSAFHSAFWFGPKGASEHDDGYVPRMKDVLKQWRDEKRPRKTWQQARSDFRNAERHVDELLAERREAAGRQHRRRQLAEAIRALPAQIETAATQLQQIEGDLERHHPVVEQANAARLHAAQQHDRHVAIKPNALETIFTLGAATRRWRHQLVPLSTALGAAETHEHAVTDHGRRIQAARQHAQIRLSALEDDLTRTRRAHAEHVAKCAQDEQRIGAGYPGDTWTGDARELHAPWLDTKLDLARSELFLAALELHRDFLAATAETMLDGLRGAVEVAAGSYPSGLNDYKLRAAWQLFFLVVPVVSTTFAAAGRMFGDSGREAVGWLLIDEAGQAAPQYAAGAIWRAKRVIAVGDPLQLEPVVSIPKKALRDVAHSYRISRTWIPPRASVQTLADRVTTHGTMLPQGDEPVWVSAPLRVHRRCDDPMFTLCNQIAYDGIMVNGVHRALPDRFDDPEAHAPPIVASHWADEPADTPGTHLQTGQIKRLKRALTYLKTHGVPPTDVIAISPFRAVADRLDALSAEYAGLRAGTIHTAQGREAPVVVLVLGGNPESPRAKDWAASTVNLVNVAASRAQRRLYVIGDRTAWEKHNYFRELSAVLA